MEGILLLKSIYKYENMCDSDYKHLWLYRRGFNNKKIGNQKPCDCMEFVIIWEVTIGRDDCIKNIEFSSKISNWPASTRAELGAIWTALLVMLQKAEVHIHTDSACAISAIKKEK